MREGFGFRALGAVAALGLLALAGCKSTGGLNSAGPNEFAVARNAPLVVPPDFALTPPRPGQPRPQEADSSAQALQAMFGGPASTSPGEASLLNAAGASESDPGIRSAAGDPQTDVVDKGSATRQILAAPAGAGQDASVTTTPAH